MNRILFDTLIFLNGFLAVLAIGLGAYVGWNMPMFAVMRPVGLLIGAGAGLTFAALVCGTLSYFALMERHMRMIAETVAGGGGVRPSEARAAPMAGRQEPPVGSRSIVPLDVEFTA